MEPPAVKSPRVVSGNPIQSRSQSSALASSCTSAGAACQTPVNRFAVLADEVRQRRGEDAASGDEREVTRRRRVEGTRDVVVEQLVEQRLERATRLWRGLAQRPAERAGIDVAEHGLRSERGDDARSTAP